MRSAIVIGGGIGGLGAALELERHGVPVTVLEAKSRWGGRIHTISETNPIELGAEFVHGRNPQLLKVISEAGFTTRQQEMATSIFTNGTRRKVDFWERVESVIDRVDTSRPDVPFETILETAEMDESDRASARGYVEGFNAADCRRISAHAIVRAGQASSQMEGDWQGRIVEGYGSLIAYFVNKIKATAGRLLLKTPARLIDWRPGKVEVTTHGAHPMKFEANAAILTLPLGVWKAATVSLQPALPAKVDAVQQLEFGNVVKLILEFRERWWDEPFGFLHGLELPFPTWWQSSNLMLTAWAGGAQTQKLLHLDKDQLVSEALGSLGRVMSESDESLRKRLVHCHFHDWTSDPEIRGAYSYIPVNGLELPRVLSEPVQETLFFAGEATALDAQMGTTFGALESGLRAAKHFLDQSA